MDLQQRTSLMVRLGDYLLSNAPDLQAVKERASRKNAWFTDEFVETAITTICNEFLAADKLSAWFKLYNIPNKQPKPQNIGIVMAGNIPLVGFHDFLTVFMSGHTMTIKPSSKDAILIKFIVQTLIQWQSAIAETVVFAENLKGCDAYIATGSNNSSRYFDYYFGKYPNVIRRNRTSVAVLDGTETAEELDLLADDIQQYFGMGCRNVTKLFVPQAYNFVPLLDALRKYDHYFLFHKYKNNYDYQLALLMMAQKFYMTNDSIVLAENDAFFSPVSQVNYTFYTDRAAATSALQTNVDVQCIVGHDFIPFGKAQKPALTDYADGVDTMAFLLAL